MFFHRWRINQFKINMIIAVAMLIAGATSLLASALLSSSTLALIGLAIVFWGAILLYITPSRHVPLEVMNTIASSVMINIENMIAESNATGKGVYLSPKFLKDYESSLVFIPKNDSTSLPNPQEVNEEKLYSRNPEGIFLVPPGSTLSKLFENKLGTSFGKTDLAFIQQNLPKLLTESMEIAENIRIEPKENTITVEITNHIFEDICEETRKLAKTHEQIGCLLPSAIACALAKATGRPIVIKSEEKTPDQKTTIIQYRQLEG